MDLPIQLKQPKIACFWKYVQMQLNTSLENHCISCNPTLPQRRKWMTHKASPPKRHFLKGKEEVELALQFPLKVLTWDDLKMSLALFHFTVCASRLDPNPMIGESCDHWDSLSSTIAQQLHVDRFKHEWVWVDIHIEHGKEYNGFLSYKHMLIKRMLTTLTSCVRVDLKSQTFINFEFGFK